MFEAEGENKYQEINEKESPTEASGIFCALNN